MRTPSIPLKILLCLCVAPASFAGVQPTQASTPLPSIRIHHYDIDLVLNPAHHSMDAQVTVTFSAIKDLTTAAFLLNPAMHVSEVTNAAGHALETARVPADNRAIRVSSSAPLKQGDKAVWTFRYSGKFNPYAGGTNTDAFAQFASIGEPVSYLLDAAYWFPAADYETAPFTATVHVHVPAGERVLGSGEMGAPHPDANGLQVFDFDWTRPGFPGTILAGKFLEPFPSDVNAAVHVYLIETKPDKDTGAAMNGSEYAALADRQYSYFRSLFGPADSKLLNVVELPDGATPAYSAPGIAAISGQQMREGNSSRLLANTIAHQWWGNQVSAVTPNDAWITNGMCRYAELEYLRHTSGQTVFADAIQNTSASALAYDSSPLSDAAQFSPLSIEFQSMTYDKGAMILRMLQWQIGDAAFEQTLRNSLSVPDRSISSSQLETIAEAASHQILRPFFTQWLDNTGAPNLQDNWTLYRLGDEKGFRTVGEISEDLDLFQMAADVRVEMPGKTINRRVDVAGPQSQFVIDTPDIPKKISLDPDRWLLRNDPDMQVRVHILRGQNMAAKNDLAGAIQEYRGALAIDNISSLASYRLGEIYFRQRNYQAAANSFRDALHGDGVPKWTEVWSDLELGKTFDASGQRERAINQYREALQTEDDTSGALDLAREYIAHAYQAPAQPE